MSAKAASRSRVSRAHKSWPEIDGEAFDCLTELVGKDTTSVKTVRLPESNWDLKRAPALAGIFDGGDKMLVRFTTSTNSVRLRRVKYMCVHPFKDVNHFEGLKSSRISGNPQTSDCQIRAYQLKCNPYLVLYAAQGQIPAEFVECKGRLQGTLNDSTEGSMGQNHLDNEFIEEIFSPSHSDHETASPSTSEFNDSSDVDVSETETVSMAIHQLSRLLDGVDPLDHDDIFDTVFSGLD